MRYIKAFKYKKWANSELISFGKRQIHLLPEDDANFFIRILNHTTVVDSLFISRILGTQELYTADNTVETPTLSELEERLEQNDTRLIELVESEIDLEQIISFRFTDGDRGQLSIDEILMHLLTHGSNHRGMASRVLGSNGLERPKDTFTRFLHELEPSRRHVSGENQA